MEQRPAAPTSYTAPPAHAPQAARTYNPWAIVSVSFAASTVLGSWCFGGLIAVITGHVARHQIKASGEAAGNLALIGLDRGLHRDRPVPALHRRIHLFYCLRRRVRGHARDLVAQPNRLTVSWLP